VIIISYAGGIHFNMTLDPAVVEDSNELTRLFLDECRDLASQLGVPCSDKDMLVQ
jgi:hypothetical protein